MHPPICAPMYILGTSAFRAQAPPLRAPYPGIWLRHFSQLNNFFTPAPPLVPRVHKKTGAFHPRMLGQEIILAPCPPPTSLNCVWSGPSDVLWENKILGGQCLSPVPFACLVPVSEGRLDYYSQPGSLS